MPVTEEDGPFIKIINVGEKMVINAIEGECTGRILWETQRVIEHGSDLKS